MSQGLARSTDNGTTRRWTSKGAAAIALRVTLVLLPALASLLTVAAMLRLTPSSNEVGLEIGRFAAIALAGAVAAFAADRLTARLLPLAALLRLSLVFPDQAPSRLKIAIRASSPKKLKAEVESARLHGLSSDATEAAGQVLLLTAALGEHDRRTRGHSERVRLFTRLLGEEMGIKGDDLDRLQWGALLHDVGKLTIPTEILNKPGKLDDDEWAIMSSHAAAGTQLAGPLHPFLGEFVRAADGHHEKWDGSGYPLGLAGDEIPLAGRIVAVADAYEVMTATRAYKKPMSAEAARAELTRCAGSHFDPQVVRAWLNLSVGDINKAAGPAAIAGSLPIIGEVVATFSRTVAQVAAVPAAAAAATPAMATAGAMSLAVVTGTAMAPSEPNLALDLTTTTIDVPITTTIVDLAESTTTEIPTTTTAPIVTSTTTSTTASTTTTAPTTTASTPTTTLATTVASTTSSTAAPTTTAAPPTTTTTAPPTTTTTAPPTTTTPPGQLVTLAPGSVEVLGAVTDGADLSQDGPYADRTVLFRDGPTTLTEDLSVNGFFVPAGTVVCVDLLLTTQRGDGRTITIGYDSKILAHTKLSEHLAGTDHLSASGVDYGTAGIRGMGSDDISLSTDRTKLTLTLDVADLDSIRIIVDCNS